jgi:hypothetical protein
MNIIYGCTICGIVEIVPQGQEIAMAGICEKCHSLMVITGWMEDNNEPEKM